MPTFSSSSSRGTGKVVQRSKSTITRQGADSSSNSRPFEATTGSTDGLQSDTDSPHGDRIHHHQAASQGHQLSACDKETADALLVMTVAASAAGNSKPLPDTAATRSLQDYSPHYKQQGAADATSSWRCAAFVQGAAPQQLQAKQLGTTSSRRLLAHGSQPVLLPGLHIATCKLNSSAVSAGMFSSKSPKTMLSATQEAAAMAANNLGDDISHHGAAEAAQGAAAAAAASRPQQLRVLCSSADTNRFIDADESKNSPGSYYHLRKPETTALGMSFADWLGSWQSWSHSRLLLQASICSWELVRSGGVLHSKPPTTSAAVIDTASASPAAASRTRLKLGPVQAIAADLPHLLHSTSPMQACRQERQQQQQQQPANAAADAPTTGPAADVTRLLAQLLDWPLLQQVLEDGCWSMSGGLQLVAGGRDALLPACYHTRDRLVCQVSGRCQVLLLAPDQAFTGVYPFPVAHPYDGYSCVDWEQPELEAWPQAAKVQGLVCQLAPGDSMLVPAFWFMHSQLQQQANISLVLELQPLHHKLSSPGALLLKLSRMIELWVAAELGTANVRRFLMALAAGCEWQQLHDGGSSLTSTVKGHKKMQLFHLILKQLQSVLSLNLVQQPASDTSPLHHTCTFRQASTATEASTAVAAIEAGSASCPHAAARRGQPCASQLECEARQVLAALCEERLMPTQWLNEGIPDPLYLKHQPQYFEIREEAEAAKYPQLLRHRLISNRPDWIVHAKKLASAPGISGGSGSSSTTRKALPGTHRLSGSSG